MNNTNNGGPAFPGTQYAQGVYPSGHCDGMTLRDYFAAKAMQGLLAKNGSCHPNDAYEMADAMLKARNLRHGERSL